ncbi:RNA-binding protein 8A [Rhizophlyctis rosea]|uniref:RNA-binding protein 8A n=1 Tax=Rhizophlyctis rosea TaxID=64517 RepID=A0AAD5X458_9FUNG|nr:RNA-binding protein 8A [Rhizophlyctis rosea]
MATEGNYEMAVDLDGGAEEMAIDESVAETQTARLKSGATKKKGRGFASGGGYEREQTDQTGFETLEEDSTGKAQRSVEGWIVIITGVHEEATEEDVQEKCAEYGEIKNLHLNLDRRTGYVKGYALVEYETYKHAKEAIDSLNGTEFMTNTIHADFAFVRGPGGSKSYQQVGRR